MILKKQKLTNSAHNALASSRNFWLNIGMVLAKEKLNCSNQMEVVDALSVLSFDTRH